MKSCAWIVRLLVGGALAGLLASGCASRVARDGDLGITGWRRATLGRVTILSDGADPGLQRTVGKLARFFELLDRTTKGARIGDERPVLVILFARHAQFVRVVSSDVAGLTTAESDRVTIALAIEHAYFRTTLAFHEATHAYLYRQRAAIYPAWYHEGLAEYLAGTSIRDDIAVLGGAPILRLDTLRTSEPLPLETLLKTWHPGTLPPEQIPRFYADAWAFVDLLMDPPPGVRLHDQAMDYVARTNRGEAWRPAVETAFETSLDALERVYREHRTRLVESPGRNARTVLLGPAPTPPVFESAPPIDVARAIARQMVGNAAPDREYARQLVDYVLERAPEDPEALVVRARWELADHRPERAAALIDRLPEGAVTKIERHELRGALEQSRHARVHGDRAHDEPCPHLALARSELMQVLVLDPDRIETQATLGHLYVLDQRVDPRSGIDVLSRVDGRRPGDPVVRLDLAELLQRAGRGDEAGAYLDSVIEAVAEGDLADRARRLRQLRERVTPAAPKVRTRGG